MKITILLACTCTILSKKEVVGAAIKAPLDIISLDDITPEERKELAYLQHKLGRPKRSGSGSGSGDILEALKTAIGQGIKNKIGQLAQGSASASARLSSSSSGGSSGGHGHGYSYHPPPPHESHDHKSLDFWSLKKSILNTLLQAVKAIKGGVIAVKGQLIKGGGHLISAKGKLISAKGEAITHLGKNIASSAILVPYHGHSPSGHADYGPPHESHYSAPSAPEDIYHGSPSAPGPEYHEPDHYPSHHEDHVPHGGHEGILILKKITGKSHHHHIAEESKVPSFKPIEPSGPSFGTVIGKFLSASSSLDPHKPEPFGNTASADTHYDSPSHSESHHYHEEPDTVVYKDNHKVPPSAAGYVVHDDEPEQEVIYSKKPVSSYETPFEQEPSYLSQNFDDYSASASKKNPQAVKSNSVSVQSVQKHTEKPSIAQELPKPSTSSPSFSQNNFAFPTKTVQSLPSPSSSTGTFSNGNYNLYTENVDLPNIKDYPNGFPGPLQSSNGELPASVLDQTSIGANPFGQTGFNLSPDLYHQTAPEFMTLQSFPNEVPNFQTHVSKPAHYLQTPKEDFHLHAPNHSHKPPRLVYVDSKPSHSKDNFHLHSPNHSHKPPRLVYVDSKPSHSKHKYTSTHPGRTVSSKRPSSSNSGRTTKHKPKQTYDVVRSIAYQLGPQGPKRLT